MVYKDLLLRFFSISDLTTIIFIPKHFTVTKEIKDAGFHIIFDLVTTSYV